MWKWHCRPKALINNCHSDYLDQTIINAIITILHKLDIKVIAEGVENLAQLKLLQRQGIDGIQGFYFSCPLTVKQCEKYFKNLFCKNYERVTEIASYGSISIKMVQIMSP